MAVAKKSSSTEYGPAAGKSVEREMKAMKGEAQIPGVKPVRKSMAV